VNEETVHFISDASHALNSRHSVETRNAIGLAMPLARTTAMQSLTGFEELRRQVKAVKQHTIDNLHYYLSCFEREALRNGNHVHFVRDGNEMNSIVLKVCQQHDARRVAKGKSMVTEESKLNTYLERAGLNVTETDLGEYILQQAGESPSHIVVPALHKSVDDVRSLFFEKHELGERELKGAPELVAEARGILREKFLQAEVGIVGSNALIAENGYSMLVTNEGNGDLCANLPKVLIVCTTIDKLLPRGRDAMAQLRLLARSATGQNITSYTSFYSGPRKGEDLDGPIETHFVLLDNKRSDILNSDYAEMLHCMRCGACLHHCPVYIAAGGHAYGSVYSGPMGSVLTPLLTSLEQSNALPNACTSCGRCEEVCPAGIAIPDLLRDLRHDEHQQKLSPARWRLGIRMHAWLSSRQGLYQLLTRLLIPVLNVIGRKRGYLRRLPFAGGWMSMREFPTPQRKTFMQQYKSAKGRRRE
jgi:L-lactate dehydrogenase complex protein LldF